MADAGTTWAGTHTFNAVGLVIAGSVGDVTSAVAAGLPDASVRALGTRHSFNDLADTDGTLISVTDVPADPVLDADAGTVTVGAGTRYGVLALWLEERAFALANLGSLPHISIGGATQTGTHGSGVGNGCLTTSVAALEFVDAAAQVRIVRRGDADFPALAVGLGAFGVITRVTLDVQPTYQVRQDIYRGVSWETLLADPDALLGASYSLSVFTRWNEPELEQIWVKSRGAADAAPLGDTARASETAPLGDTWMGGARMTESTTLVGGDPADLTDQGTHGPWLTRLTHFRLDGTPSNGDEIQTEYFIARADAAAALAAVRELGAQIDPLLMITELRTLAADDLWLSGAYGRDTLAIHFTWHNRPEPVAALLPAIEAALAPFGARPHWGKWHAFDAARLAAVHPRLADATAVFEARDPSGRFANTHLRRLGVR